MGQSRIQRYRKDIAQWDWDGILLDARINVDECGGMGIDDEPVQGYSYLGTVMGLTPSGKYYQPYACSNVDTCTRCKGMGKQRNGTMCSWCDGLGSHEAAQDADWVTALESIADEYGMWVENGEGSATDIFACVAVNIGGN